MFCDEVLTYVYSSRCIEYLEELIKSLDKTFSIKDKFEDMFYYGIFCNVETYSNYKEYDRSGVEVPTILKSKTESPHNKAIFVEDVINKVIRGEMKKPGWMIFVEEYEAFNDYDDSPSTYLHLIPKDEKYRGFGEALLNFLYSPNMIMKMKKL